MPPIINTKEFTDIMSLELIKKIPTKTYKIFENILNEDKILNDFKMKIFSVNDNAESNEYCGDIINTDVQFEINNKLGYTRAKILDYKNTILNYSLDILSILKGEKKNFTLEFCKDKINESKKTLQELKNKEKYLNDMFSKISGYLKENFEALNKEEIDTY